MEIRLFKERGNGGPLHGPPRFYLPSLRGGGGGAEGAGGCLVLLKPESVHSFSWYGGGFG
jgi:hypothetical protein